MKRIAVTGVGCISALGSNYSQFSQQLLQGRCGIAPLTLFDKNLVDLQQVAEVKDFSAEQYFDKKQLPFLDRFSQFSVITAREAIHQSGLVADELKDSAAVVFGTGIGGLMTLDENYQRLYGEKAKRLPPFILPKLVPSSAASNISIDMGITGACLGATSSCASSGHAIYIGAMMLATGQCDVAICGGAEAPISVGGIKIWEGLRVLASDYCRPFSVGRGGVILGEGAATLILEPYDLAVQRGATILAELVGFGMSSDAHHFISPSVEGPALAMNKALMNACLNAEQIQYINAHGSGTQSNDVTETAAIHSVFGEHAKSLAVSSTKAMHGHVLGAASAVEAAACLVALKEQVAPATIHYEGVDPECDLDYVVNKARPMKIDYAMSNSFAFGGLNTSLIFKRVS